VTATSRLLGAAIALALGAGCGTPEPAPAPTPATFTVIYAELFPRETKSQCNFCHGLPPNNISNGKLSTGTDKATAYAALVGKTSASSGCGGRALVVPGQPDASLFVAKFSEPAPCGNRMPLGGDLLSAAQLERVRSWIAAGALDD
jgi:mono/diheme cytochrome c family protein